MCPVLHLYVLFLTDQYQKKYWVGYIGRYILSLQDKTRSTELKNRDARNLQLTVK